MTFAGLCQYFDAQSEEELDLQRGGDGYVHAAFLCCDLPHVYIEEYFRILDPSQFPVIENEHLLATA